MYLTFFLLLIFLNLIKFLLDESSFLLILLNLNDLSWNLMSLVSFYESIFSRNLIKILAFTSLSFSFIEVFSSLMAFSFSHILKLSQNLISPWWIFFFLPSLMGWTIHFLWWTLFSKLDELFIFSSFELVPLSSLRTLRSGAKTIRSTLPHLEINACILNFPTLGLSF